MACPACGCKETYQYDGWDDDIDCCADDRMERCAACGAIFDMEDHAPEDDDECDEPRPTRLIRPTDGNISHHTKD